MKGDKSKSMPSFPRWIMHSNDGLIRLNRVPSQHHNKRYEKRWRRRYLKKEIENEISS